MQTASGLPIRKRIRLRDFHYGGGCSYYVTICAFESRLLFGTCENGVVFLNDVGRLVECSWLETAKMRADVVLDKHIVMPNHMHALVHLAHTATRQTLFRLIGGFKSQVTSAVRARTRSRCDVWQKRFHDRIVRSDREAANIREYIHNNPQRWRS